MATRLVGILQGVNRGKSLRNDDDAVDRLSNRYSVGIFVAFAVVVTGQLFIGKPITCWVPKHFTGSHTKYATSFCWIRNTYKLNLNDPIPAETPRENEILYYQWMPFIMLLQASLCYFPSIVWRAFNQKAGVDCDHILAAAQDYSNTGKESVREKAMSIMVNQLHWFVNTRQTVDGNGFMEKIRYSVTKIFCFFRGQRIDFYLVALYLFTKTLYLVNAVSQLYLMNSILRTQYMLYGFEIFNQLANSGHFRDSDSFPRVTMCDFNVRRLGNLHSYTVQCLLPINMYTEKMYAFLWFWLVFVALCTSVSLVSWLFRAILFKPKITYLRTHLSSCSPDNRLLEDFFHAYLRQDGMFILRMIGANTNRKTACELVEALWSRWKESHPHKLLDYVDIGESVPLENGKKVPYPVLPSAPDEVDQGKVKHV